MNKKTLHDSDITEKRLLIRVDFNVPLDIDGNIADDTRIRASLPTIRYAWEKNSKIIICTHLGRPDGRVVSSLRTAPLAKRLSELLDLPVKALSEATGPSVRAAVSSMHPGDIIFLENLRFYPEEEANDPRFSADLAGLADIFVNDAFGAAHRSHASIVGVAGLIPAVAGFVMEKELIMLGALLESPQKPFVTILGGAKVRGKVQLVEHILDTVDAVCIGGAMTATFLSSLGYPVGSSAVEEESLEYVQTIQKAARKHNVRILVPVDVIIMKDDGHSNHILTVPADGIPDGWLIGDIGQKTIDMFKNELSGAKTVFWNGPLGRFEECLFSGGTKSIALFLADLSATTILGGGSTAEVAAELGLAGAYTHVSTGGGASLTFLTGKPLPGVDVLCNRDEP
ncbi:MAG: phosphoglycerate kinase [Methanospirillaceae archaeon]|nr:phosphoglycerate kinase [Methanospirillaceae archaeon]